MLTHRGRQLLWQKPEGFADSHCRNCKAGWVRTGIEGELIVCLLDGEPVLSAMTGCNKFTRPSDED